MKFLAQNIFEKGPRDKFKAIDTFYGSLAQFFIFFKGQKQENFDFKKNAFTQVEFRTLYLHILITNTCLTIYITNTVYLKGDQKKFFPKKNKHNDVFLSFKNIFVICQI